MPLSRLVPPDQLARFGTVGLGNTLLTLAVFTVVRRAGGPIPAASGLGFAAGALNGYTLNRTWTFAAGPPTGAGLARYAAAQGVALLADIVLVTLLHRGAGAAPLAAQALSLLPISLGAFTLNRWWTFRSAPPRAGAG
jgi:putative flippase GtrA